MTVVGAPPIVNPTQLDYPAFLVNAPFSLSTEEPNNIWMEKLSDQERVVDHGRAMRQFLEVYSVLSAGALVYVLPTPRTTGLQDLVYTANLGIVPAHLPERSEVVVSNFTSPPRHGETAVGVAYFESMGYTATVCPAKFEGEADLKHLHDNVYVGGHGIRSQDAAYDWFEREYDAEVVRLAMTDEHYYHLDCSVFPLTERATMVYPGAHHASDVERLGAHTEIVAVSKPAAIAGICNSVRVGKTLVNSSCIHDLKAGTEDYDEEKTKIEELEKIAANQCLDLALVNIDEFFKSGAMLSCMVMHLNRNSYGVALL